MNIEEVRRLLAAECYSAGSQGRWAEKHGFSQGFVSAVLQGSKEPSKRLLDALGLELVVRRTYRKKKPAAKADTKP